MKWYNILIVILVVTVCLESIMLVRQEKGKGDRERKRGHCTLFPFCRSSTPF